MNPELLGRKAYIDTNVAVYYLEDVPKLGELAAAVIDGARDGDFRAVVGDAVVAEVMVGAYQSGNREAEYDFREFFDFPGLFERTRHHADDFDLAARIRGRRGTPFIDALHVATAINAGCYAFVTNDKRLGELDEIRVMQLSEAAGE